MKFNKLLFRFLVLATFAVFMQSCVEDDDFDAPEIPQYVLGDDACYTEDFQSYEDGATTIGGSQIITAQGSKSWNVDIYQGEGHIKLGAYNSGEVIESWFIQGVDFDVVDRMSFETLSGYHNGDVLTVKYSTDYDYETGNPTAATWTDITDQFSISESVGGFASEWTQSTIYTFPSSLSGKGFVAYVYSADDVNNGATTTMELDDIQYGSSADGDCTYAISEGGSTGGGTGGSDVTPLDCLSETFSEFADGDDEFATYITADLTGDRLWGVKEFDSNKYIQMSAYNGASHDSWFLVNVDFDQADTFSFKTKDGYNNGEVLTVLYSTSYTAGETINPSDWTDITSNFSIASGSSNGYADSFTESGSYDLSNVSGNGFIAFRYVGANGGTTTTMQVDDIEISNAENADCTVDGGGTGGTTDEACATQDFESFTDGDIEFTGYQNVATDAAWTIKEYSDNKYIQMSAYNTTGAQSAWFIMGVDFDAATGVSFDTKDGYNNGDALTVMYSTDYDEQGNPSAATWTDITSEFTISTGNSSGYAESFTESGTYNFSGLSGQGYVAFKYDGAGDGVTTTIQVDNINVYGAGTCTFDVAPVDNGGGTTEQTHVGGSEATPLSCATEEFTEFAVDATEFAAYEGIAVVGDRFWGVKEYNSNKYVQMSAYNGAEHDVWMLVNVNFDEADTFSFKTKDGYNNGDALTVLYSTSHTVGQDVDASNWTDITSEFAISTGNSSGYASEFTESGAYDLSGISGNGFIAFRYQGNADGGVTTTIQIDDIMVVDNENADCTTDGGGTGGTELVSNGDFEAWTGGVLDVWTSEDGTTITQETGIVAEGSSSAKFEVTTTTQGDTDFRQSIDVVGGTTYTVSVQVYQADGGSRARLYVDGYQGYSDPAVTGEWQTVTYEFTPADSGTIEVGLRFYDTSDFDTSSVIYVDDFKVVAQ